MRSRIARGRSGNWFRCSRQFEALGRAVDPSVTGSRFERERVARRGLLDAGLLFKSSAKWGSPDTGR